MKRTSILGAAALAVINASGTAMAAVEKIEIKSRETYHASRVGSYVKITGSFVGSLDAAEPIPNLARAPHRPDVRVEYESGFIILAPESAGAGNRVLLFDVENNGRPVTHGLYNTPIEGTNSGLDFGNGFIEDNGYIVAVTDWQNGRGIRLPEYPGSNGKPVPITAVGFAAVRDFAAFLRFETKDRSGTANPVAGAVEHAIAAGSSQTGRFLKSFVHHGFNRAGTRTVFDGIHVHVGQSGSMPFIPPAGVSQETINLTITGDSSVYPFTYAEVLAPLAGRGETPPKIIATNVEADYFRRRLSLVRTGANGITEQPIPPSVRMWDVGGGSHGIIPMQDCDMPRSNLDWHPILRAALVRLTSWVVSNQAPPAMQLIPLMAGDPVPYLLPAPTKDYPNAKLMVPKRNADGNSEGGIRLPLVAVPLQTWGAWNAPLTNNCGDMAGFAYPFARTRFQRMMTNDPRPSLEERYPSRAAFMQKITAAVDELVRDGYLLRPDADAITENARKAAAAIPEPANDTRD
jgi:alpha/beta hydrolase family protein